MSTQSQSQHTGQVSADREETHLRRQLEAHGLKLIKWDHCDVDGPEGGGWMVADLDHRGAVFGFGNASLAEVAGWLEETRAM